MFRGVLPEPAAAGGGDVVVSAAGVDGRLDFSLTALWSKEEFSENIHCLFVFFAELAEFSGKPLEAGFLR